MGDSKLYSRTKASEIQTELRNAEKKPKSAMIKKTILKKIITNMTMGNNEVILLSGEVLKILNDQSNDLEVRRLCYLFFTSYYSNKPKDTLEILPFLKMDFYKSMVSSVRTIAVKTLSAIQLDEFIKTLVNVLQDGLTDSDHEVRKCCAFTVARVFDRLTVDSKQVLLTSLNGLLQDNHISVIAAALSSLNDITERSDGLKLSIDFENALHLASNLGNCDKWSQIYILNSLMSLVPQLESEAIELIDLCIPYLQSDNCSISLNSLKVIVYLGNYVDNLVDNFPVLPTRISNSVSTLMSKSPEVQFLVMRNIILLLLNKSTYLTLDVRMFFCQFDDPIYIKDTKLEIIFLLANESNISIVLKELEEYAMEIDVPMVCKSIRAIGNLSIKLENSSDQCVEVLKNLLSNSISYIVQEIAVIVKDIFRKFPGRFNFLIAPLIDNIHLIEESESKVSMIWVIGEYNDLIDCPIYLLKDIFNNIRDETNDVKVTLLTAIMKTYVMKPDDEVLQDLVINILKYTTEEEVDDPDLRERGFFYWRLISSNDPKVKDIIKSDLPLIRSDTDTLPQDILEELELNIGTLASIYLRPVKQVFRLAKAKSLPDSPALVSKERRSIRSRSSTVNSTSTTGEFRDTLLSTTSHHLRSLNISEATAANTSLGMTTNNNGSIMRSNSTASSALLTGNSNRRNFR